MSPQRQTITNSVGTGDCMMACYASYLDKNLSELPKIEKLFIAEVPENFWWYCQRLFWNLLGYEYMHSSSEEECLADVGDDYYFVTGLSNRDPETRHMCIYKKGELFHDPHPDDTGLITQEYFEWPIKF